MVNILVAIYNLVHRKFQFLSLIQSLFSILTNAGSIFVTDIVSECFNVAIKD